MATPIRNGTLISRFDPTLTITGVLKVPEDVRAMTIDRDIAKVGALIHTASVNGDIRRYTRAGIALGLNGSIGTWPSGLVFESSRNVAPVLRQPPNDRLVRVSFPKAPGRGYVLALSASGFTRGLSLPDGRTIPLRPDGFRLRTPSLNQ